ncbi:MAG TPA: MFS transporter [Thermomicrobiales bacterium]|nr:MFS transporter [Thermomicrobiales bacterium]
MSQSSRAPQGAMSPSAAHVPAFDGRERWLALITVLIGTFMILLDSTIVNVAIPSIQRTLSASYENIEWVISGYALAYGLLLIPSGRLGDRFGHKLMFLIGLVGFTAASAACGTARSVEALILWRVIQGAMAGVMNPQITAVIQLAFPPQERGKAFGIYGSVIGIATAMGPLVGGLLIAANINGLEWEPIFLINIPIGVIAVIMALRVLKQTFGRGGSLDLVGILLVSAAVLLLTVPLIEGRPEGWPLWTWLSMGASAVVLAVFAWWERRRIDANEAPLVDVRLFRSRAFTAGMGIALAYFGGFVGIFFISSLLLQNGMGRSALYSGLTVMPFSLGSLISASQSDKVARKLGRTCLTLGSVLVMAGIAGLFLTMRHEGTSLAGWQLAPWFLVAGFGSGLVVAPNVTLVLAGVPREDAGSASGVLSATQRIGQAIGICLVGIVLFGVLQSGAPAAADRVSDSLRSDLAAAQMPAGQVDGSIATFERCFAERAAASDPTATPEGCPAIDTGATDPVSAAFAKAGTTALSDSFVRASEQALIVSFALVALTFLLVFALPRRVAGAGHGGPPPVAE